MIIGNNSEIDLQIDQRKKETKMLIATQMYYNLCDIKIWNQGVTPYTFAPTKQPKYSCNSDVNFQTEGEKACGFRNLTEQPFCREKKKLIRHCS